MCIIWCTTQPKDNFLKSTLYQSLPLVSDLLIQHLPKATEDLVNFLKVNKEFVDKLCNTKDINLELSKHSFKHCPNCSENLSQWLHKTKESYLVALGEMKKVDISVQYCQKCNILLYPNLFEVGLIALHNKENIRFYFGFKLHIVQTINHFDEITNIYFHSLLH